jgi:hypothetical protein
VLLLLRLLAAEPGWRAVGCCCRCRPRRLLLLLAAAATIRPAAANAIALRAMLRVHCVRMNAALPLWLSAQQKVLVATAAPSVREHNSPSRGAWRAADPPQRPLTHPAQRTAA